MGRRLLIPSMYKNITREVVIDPMSGETSIIVHEDLDPLFARNKQMRLDNPQGYVDGDRDVRTVASISVTLGIIIQRETGIDVMSPGRELTTEEWRTISGRYLMNPDYSKFRTSDVTL